MLSLLIILLLGVPVTLAVHGQGCENGATDFRQNNECIQAFGSAVSQNSARQSCIHLDFYQGQLVQPKDAYENNQAVLLVQQTLNSQSAYIGVEKLDDKGTWGYVDGTPLSYINWADKEPSTDPTKTCAAMLSTGQWKAVDCGSEMPFICSYPDNK